MNKTNLYNFDTVETHTFAVEGMTCEKCVSKIEDVLKKQKGVKEAKADLKDQSVTVTYDNKETDMPELHETILKSGFRPAATTR